MSGAGGGGDSAVSDEAMRDGAGQAEPGGSGDGTVGAADVDVAAADERRIRRGSVTVEVEDLAKAAGQVRDLTGSLQGYVSDESIGLAAATQVSVQDGDEDVSPPQLSGPGEARLVLRVPESAMTEAMDALAGLGVELSRWSTETPVETALVDLESRVATRTASVERIRALLEEASSLSDVVTLESELSTREADLESIQAQQQALAGKAATSTVTAVLQTPEATETAEEGDGFLAGLAAGWDALAASTVVLLTVVGAMFPFAVVGALVVLPLLAWRRRVRRALPVAVSTPSA